MRILVRYCIIYSARAADIRYRVLGHAPVLVRKIIGMSEKEGLVKQGPPATYQGAAIVFQPQVGL